MDFLVWGIQDRAGPSRTPPEERGGKGAKPAVWITTVPFSFLVGRPKVEDCCVYGERAFHEFSGGGRIKGSSCEATRVLL